MEWPEVTILICTYERKAELEKTLTALVTQVAYAGKLKWLIADNGSPSKFASRLVKSKQFAELDIGVLLAPENLSWGTHINRALEQTSDYVFFIEDDYVLTQSLDLSAGIALLELLPHIGYLRYRGTAGEHVVLHQMDADISSVLPDYRDGVGLPGHLAYCLLDNGSPTLYIYTSGPHLKHRGRFHDFYGPYGQGLLLGATEETYAHHVKNMMSVAGAPCLAILPDWVSARFDHIGHSWQAGETDTVGKP